MTTEYIYSTSTHPAPLSVPTIVLSLPDLPRSPDLSDDEIFEQILGKLDPLVGNGYVLVVLATESSADKDGNVSGDPRKGRREPGVGWWVSRWRSLPYKYVFYLVVRWKC
jgi:hypothetical protein